MEYKLTIIGDVIIFFAQVKVFLKDINVITQFITRLHAWLPLSIYSFILKNNLSFLNNLNSITCINSLIIYYLIHFIAILIVSTIYKIINNRATIVTSFIKGSIKVITFSLLV